METARKYTFEDLKLGMTVRQSQLSNIFGKRIILINSRFVPKNDAEGEIAYLDNNSKEDYMKWFRQTEIPITPIYQSEEDLC